MRTRLFVNHRHVCFYSCDKFSRLVSTEKFFDSKISPIYDGIINTVVKFVCLKNSSSTWLHQLAGVASVILQLATQPRRYNLGVILPVPLSSYTETSCWGWLLLR